MILYNLSVEEQNILNGNGGIKQCLKITWNIIENAKVWHKFNLPERLELQMTIYLK